VYAEAGDTSVRAVEAARTAHSMRPYDLAAARDLVRLYLRLDRRTEAVELVKNSLASNRRLERGAWTMVVEQDLIRARELLGESRIDAALERLALAEQIADRTLHPEAADRALAATSRLINDHRAAGLFNEAQARFAEDDREGARRLLHRALELADEGAVAASCRHLLTIIDHPESLADREIELVSPSPTPGEIGEFNRLIAARQFDEAVQYLESLRSRLGEAQQRWLDDRVAEVQRTIDYNRFVDAYNEAVDYYNQRRYDQAVEVLEEYLATGPENGKARAARSLLDDARSAME
jgi:tetratricopeptide (TPR) repeat protein